MENHTTKKIWCSRTAIRRRSVTTEDLGNEGAARGSDTTPPFIVCRWISKFAFGIMVESDDLNPPTDLTFDRLSQGKIASSSEGVVLPGDRFGGGLQHWRMCDEETMGNLQGRGLHKTRGIISGDPRSSVHLSSCSLSFCPHDSFQVFRYFTSQV